MSSKEEDGAPETGVRRSRRARARGRESPGCPRERTTETEAVGPAYTDASLAHRLTACPECGAAVHEESWEVVCGECGLVVGADPLSRGPEWRHDEDGLGGRRRCNGRPSRASANPGWGRTDIGRAHERRDASTAAVAFGRLAGLHARAADYDTKLLNHALPEVKRVCGALDLRGDTVERACGIFRRARSTGFLDRRCIETVCGAAVYAACREHRIARLPSDVAAVLRLTDDGVAGSTKLVDAMLGVYRQMRRDDAIPFEAHHPTAPEFVPRFASGLDVPDGTCRRARLIAVRAVRTGAAGSRPPRSVAGGALALAIAIGDDDVNDGDVAAVADVTVETLRGARRALTDGLPTEAIPDGDGTAG